MNDQLAKDMIIDLDPKAVRDVEESTSASPDLGKLYADLQTAEADRDKVHELPRLSGNLEAWDSAARDASSAVHTAQKELDDRRRITASMISNEVWQSDKRGFSITVKESVDGKPFDHGDTNKVGEELIGQGVHPGWVKPLKRDFNDGSPKASPSLEMFVQAHQGFQDIALGSTGLLEMRPDLPRWHRVQVAFEEDARLTAETALKHMPLVDYRLPPDIGDNAYYIQKNYKEWVQIRQDRDVLRKEQVPERYKSVW